MIVPGVREYFKDRPHDLLIINVAAGEGWEKLCPLSRAARARRSGAARTRGADASTEQDARASSYALAMCLLSDRTENNKSTFPRSQRWRPFGPGPVRDSNALTCHLGTVAAGASMTITVTSTATTPAPACQDLPNPAAIATDTHGNKAQDDGFLTRTPQLPPQLRVVKSPKAGTFAEGGQTSYTIVVSNPVVAGSSSATNITLTEQLPGNGGLVWSNVSTSQGLCTIVSNLLSCNLGMIAAGGSVSITVTSGANTPAAACEDQPNNGTLGATGFLEGVALAESLNSPPPLNATARNSILAVSEYRLNHRRLWSSSTWATQR